MGKIGRRKLGDHVISYPKILATELFSRELARDLRTFRITMCYIASDTW